MLTNTTNAATLPELFDSLFASIERENISIAERLHIIEMAAVLADLYATQTTIMLSELTRISPIPSERPAYTHFAAPVIAALQAQSEFATQRSGEYRKLHERLRTTHPQISGPWNAPKTILHAYDDIFTYPLGRLLQALPDEITNQRNFTSEQVQACRTVAMLADLANRTAIDGIQAIGELLAIAGEHTPAETLPKFGRLIEYLTQEARFMAQNSLEYWDAADNIPCVN